MIDQEQQIKQIPRERKSLKYTQIAITAASIIQKYWRQTKHISKPSPAFDDYFALSKKSEPNIIFHPSDPPSNLSFDRVAHP